MEEQIMQIIVAAAPSIAAIGSVGGFLAKMIGKTKEIKSSTKTTVDELKQEVESLKEELTSEVKKVNDASDAQAIRDQYMTVLNEVNELKKEITTAVNEIKKKRY